MKKKRGSTLSIKDLERGIEWVKTGGKNELSFSERLDNTKKELEELNKKTGEYE